jgi:hypothetical protein
VLQGGFACRVDFVVGSLDEKFVQIARAMTPPEDTEVSEGEEVEGGKSEGLSGEFPGVKMWPRGRHRHRVVEVEHSGHAVHEEQPIALISALQLLLQSPE